STLSVMSRWGEEVAVQESGRSLVPRPPAGAAVRPPDDRADLPRLLAAAALGLAVEAQRRSLGTAAAVATRVGSPLRILARPALALAQGSVAVARHHLDLDRWAARGLAEQQRAREAAARAIRGVIAALAAAVLDEVDLDQVVARVDLDRIVDRVDPNAIAARIDLDELVDSVDIDAIAKRIDLDAIVARVDIDAILARVDLPALTEEVIDEVDLGEIIRESSSTMATETVDALRVQGMRVDGLVSRVIDRLLLREGQRQTGPLDGQPRP
ncbi:MAG TPA: hypothetical protein VFN05_11720, partial [Actinomycetes bacterium]|nr:hypothetical protein [Actinomycetes bacterium]